MGIRAAARADVAWAWWKIGMPTSLRKTDQGSTHANNTQLKIAMYKKDARTKYARKVAPRHLTHTQLPFWGRKITPRHLTRKQ